MMQGAVYKQASTCGLFSLLKLLEIPRASFRSSERTLVVDLTRHLLYHYAHLGVIFTSVVVLQWDCIATAEKVNQPDIVDFD